MLNSWLIVGIGAGLAAAVLHATMLAPSALSLILFYLAPLPLFLAGLGWGTASALTGAMAGALAVTVMGAGATSAAGGLKFAALFAVSVALAPVVISHFALKNRPAAAAPAPEGEPRDHGVEWYPEGRLTLIAAALAGAVMTLVIVMAGPDAETFRATLKAMTDEVLKAMPTANGGIQPDQLSRISGLLVDVIPPVTTAMWLVVTMVNLWVAAAILRRSGRSLRPWAPFGELAFPRSATIGLGAAMLAAFVPGTVGLVASVFAAALLAAFLLLGLAVLHGLLAGHPARGMLLTALYLSLLLLSGLPAVPIILLALADQTIGLRRMAKGQPGPE